MLLSGRDFCGAQTPRSHLGTDFILSEGAAAAEWVNAALAINPRERRLLENGIQNRDLIRIGRLYDGAEIGAESLAATVPLFLVC